MLMKKSFHERVLQNSELIYLINIYLNIFQLQLFNNESEFSHKIWQSVTETPPEHRFVWAHWRRNHAFVTVSPILL